MSDRIKNTEKFDIELGPMINYFNALGDRHFMYCLNLFSQNTGFGNEYHICSLASSRHPLEEVEFEGDVRFIDATGTSGEKSVIVDYATFYKFLKMACENYLETHPQDKSKIEDDLKDIRARYNIEF